MQGAKEVWLVQTVNEFEKCPELFLFDDQIKAELAAKVIFEQMDQMSQFEQDWFDNIVKSSGKAYGHIKRFNSVLALIEYMKENRLELVGEIG